MADPSPEAPASTSRNSPFDLREKRSYLRWREAKLAAYPLRSEDALVEVGDPRALTRSEHHALLERCRRYNFAVYASRVLGADKEIARLLGRQFGLLHLDRNWLADDDGITSLAASAGGQRGDYIPYTDRAIHWHTDGYYNPPQRRIRAMVLHCVADAASGGESALLDHEIAYLLLRDANPELVRALMAPDAMTIPARGDESGVARAEETGPVFFVDAATAMLGMRYTARTRSIAWKQDPATAAALAQLADILADSPYIARVRLAPGMGVIANNVLHDRAAFRDEPGHRRLLYRARYYDRIEGTWARSVPAVARSRAARAGAEALS
jgi:alpha-ketoglutarate-dependent taurine dioxygenase